MSKKKIEVVKSTTEPNKNDIWFNGKEFKYFGKKGWENIIKTSNIPAGDGTGSTSGTSARILYVDFTGQGLTDEQKAYNAETFTILQNEKIFIYVDVNMFYAFSVEYDINDTKIVMRFNVAGNSANIKLYPNGDTSMEIVGIDNVILFLTSDSTSQYKELNSASYNVLYNDSTARVVIQYMGNIYYPVGVICYLNYVDFTCFMYNSFSIIRVHSDGEIEKI